MAICLKASMCSICWSKWSAVSLSSDSMRTKEDGPDAELGIFSHQRTSRSGLRETALNSFCRLRRLHENLTKEHALAVLLEVSSSSLVGAVGRQAQSITRSTSSWGKEFTDLYIESSIHVESHKIWYSLLSWIDGGYRRRGRKPSFYTVERSETRGRVTIGAQQYLPSSKIVPRGAYSKPQTPQETNTDRWSRCGVHLPRSRLLAGYQLVSHKPGEKVPGTF